MKFLIGIAVGVFVGRRTTRKLPTFVNDKVVELSFILANRLTHLSESLSALNKENKH